MQQYAEVALHRSFGNELKPFTYSVPSHLEQDIKNGQLVSVPFGKKELKAIVTSLHSNKPDFETKDLTAILQPEPLLKDWQIKLLHWMSEQYFCSIHSALKVFLPTAILKVSKRKRKEIIHPEIEKKASKNLTIDQKTVLNSILKGKEKTYLLHGITGAGKTEIYLQIAQSLKDNEQLVLLVPEISLTPQLIEYFAFGTGKHISSIHSRLSESEKRDIWNKIGTGETQILVGSRSALFAPFTNLKHIIIDEEHEWSYKQDQTPRYHTRTVAEKICSIIPGTKLVLGSATPSIESYYKAQNGLYKLLQLNQRAIAKSQLPEVEVVDLREELRKKNYSVFSDLLQQKIEEKLAKKEQVILFLNRRGAASSVSCRDCGHIVKCPHCDVSLTFHNNNSKPRLICHYCGIMQAPPSKCPNCQSIYIKLIGIGTQKIEAEAKALFPKARIFRADRDTTTQKDSFTELYQKLKDHEIDILIGTQMIGKGLHLPKVNLVGVILADVGLHIPDFRSSEKTFQTITQVAGRSGRKEAGEVIIQSYIPEHPAIQCAKEHDYISFYNDEIKARENLDYPPFSEIIRLLISDFSKDKCLLEHKKMLTLIQKEVENHPDSKIEVLAHPALIERIHNKYRYIITIKGNNLEAVINPLMSKLHKWKIDRDPYWG